MNLLSQGVHFWVQFDPDRRMGGSRANVKDVWLHKMYHNSSYIQRISALFVASKLMNVLVADSAVGNITKFSNMGGARAQKAEFRCPAHWNIFFCKPMVLMESEGVPFALSTHKMPTTPNGDPEPEKFGFHKFLSSISYDVENSLNSTVKLCFKSDQNNSYRRKTGSRAYLGIRIALECTITPVTYSVSHDLGGK